MPRPEIDLQPRVERDLNDLLDFIARQPWGDRLAREYDIWCGVADILEGPESNDIGMRRRDTGIELRRHNAAQFAIIYAYYAPSIDYPDGVVSIRAIRHSRARHVFRGVRETPRIGSYV